MRISPLSPDRCPWYLRIFFWQQRRQYGEILQPVLLWARAPRSFLAFTLLYASLNRKNSPLAAPLRSLVIVRISQINHCPFCVDLNSTTLLRLGTPPEKIETLDGWRDSEVFTATEKAALEYAEAMTLSDREVDDALMTRVRKFFDEDAVVELTALIGMQNLSSKFNSALGIPSQGLCRLPDPAAPASPS